MLNVLEVLERVSLHLFPRELRIHVSAYLASFAHVLELQWLKLFEVGPHVRPVFDVAPTAIQQVGILSLVRLEVAAETAPASY